MPLRHRNTGISLPRWDYKQADIDAKLKSVFDGVFYGPDKVYFEVGDSMAYISDVKIMTSAPKVCPTD